MSPELRKKLDQAFTTLFYVALGVGLAYLTGQPALRDKTIIPTLGIARAVTTDDGDAQFELAHLAPRFRIARPDDPVMAALRESAASGNSVTLRARLDGARFAGSSNVPEYWVESVEYLGKTYGPFDAQAPWSWRTMGEAEAALLRGVAFEVAGQNDDARKEAEVALAQGGMSDGKMALAHRTRARALQSLAYPTGTHLNDRDDAMLMTALNDIREAARLDPSDDTDLFRQGNLSVSLGAYPEAIALFEEAGRRSKNQSFHVAIAKGAAYREMGDFNSALRELDSLVKAHGPQNGMMFHYHRGWTLTKLARYSEAEAEFTAGFKSQPDYLWAFVARACARGQQGHIAQAMEDQKRALELWDRDAKVNASTRADTARHTTLAHVLEELEAARAANPEAPSPAACADLFSTPTTSRHERSRVFKPAETH